MGMYNQVTTPVYTLDEATSTIRLTVFSTNNVDNNFPNGFSGNSSAFPTFALGEIRLFDGEGNKVEVTADMTTTNALALNEGTIDALVDDDLTTHFHSTYSDGEVPQAYHYIEIALSEPMSKFQLQWDTRFYYFYTDPTYVGITGGTEALPWKDEEFVLGNQVTSVDALQPKKLYVIRGNYFEFTRTENQRTLPSYGEAFYHSPIGAAHYGRVATWSYSANTAQWQIVPVAVATSINNIVVDEPAGEVISTSYITPDGVTSNVPVKGVCIIRRVYANGVITTEKEFIK